MPLIMNEHGEFVEDYEPKMLKLKPYDPKMLRMGEARNKRVEAECPACHGTYVRNSNSQVYCSEECRKLARKKMREALGKKGRRR